jgi:hypothetical protein
MAMIESLPMLTVCESPIPVSWGLTVSPMTATQPFLTNLISKLESGTFVSDAGSFVVPKKKTLLIETIGVDLQIPANQQVLFASIGISNGPTETTFPIPVHPIGTISLAGAAAETHYSGLHSVRIPVAAGSEVHFTIGRNSDRGTPVAICSVAGCLTDSL